MPSDGAGGSVPSSGISAPRLRPRYASFSHLIRREVRPSDRILILGNGNSNLPFELQADGFSRVTATDLSPVVTERMRLKAEARGAGGIAWCVEDMMALSFPDGSFDAVIEKGVFDVLMVRVDRRRDGSLPPPRRRALS